MPPLSVDMEEVPSNRPGFIRLVVSLAALLVSLTAFETQAMAAELSLKELFESGRIRRVVAFGDSVVLGLGLDEGWPQILGRELQARYPGTAVVNAGRKGDTVADGHARVSRGVLEPKPDLVMISFGLNDAKKGTPLIAFGKDLRAIIEQIRGVGATVALLTTTRLAMGTSAMIHLDPDPYNEVIRSLAAECGVPLIDVYRETTGGNLKRFYLDLIHPNEEGCRRLAEVIGRSLLR